MTTVLSSEPALMCAAELQDTIEFLSERYQKETNKRERRRIFEEYRAATTHYNQFYTVTYSTSLKTNK